jgi:hypothetical protein
MANPIYHDDPEWYERPGETVLLAVDKKPLLFAFGDLPWQLKDPPVRDPGHTQPCVVCGKTRPCIGGLCAFCSRAQHADECHLARARQPQPSGPRIHGLREGWER